MLSKSRALKNSIDFVLRKIRVREVRVKEEIEGSSLFYVITSSFQDGFANILPLK